MHWQTWCWKTYVLKMITPMQWNTVFGLIVAVEPPESSKFTKDNVEMTLLMLPWLCLLQGPRVCHQSCLILWADNPTAGRKVYPQWWLKAFCSVPVSFNSHIFTKLLISYIFCGLQSVDFLDVKTQVCFKSSYMYAIWKQLLHRNQDQQSKWSEFEHPSRHCFQVVHQSI